ncbi:MAG: NAD-dependent epimerase/dehydratase family protein [Gammaproteobacteria bacterium]
MRILVTGHQGYIGTVLVPLLLKHGHDVTGLDNGLFQRCTFTGRIIEVPAIKKDIRDLALSDLAGFEAVVHLAGLSNDPLGDYNPRLTEEINWTASVRLAELAKIAGIERFVFASSCSVYGAAGNDIITETAEFNPVTPYGRSKAMVEIEVAKLAGDGFSPTFLRASTVYGVSPRLRFDLVVNNLTAWAFATGKIYLKSDGEAWRPIVHVEDIARCYLEVLQAPRDVIHNQAFNLGSTTDNYQIRELAERISKLLPHCKIVFAKGAAPDKRCYRVDCDKISERLPECAPRWTIVNGIKQLYESYRTEHLKLEDFEGSRFKRIAHVKKLIGEGILDSSLRFAQSDKSERIIDVTGKAVYECP